MVFRPASTDTAMNGNACHITSSVITVYAGSGALVQLNPDHRAPPPSHAGTLPSSQSATPPSGSNSQTKMTDADTAGIAQASSAEVDTKAAIFGPSRLSSNPTRVPTTSVSGTTTAANTTLIRR